MLKMTKEELQKLLPRIELVPIAEIRPNPKNPRTLSEYKFKRLVKSVEDFWQMLFIRPLVLDDDNIILGGNQRYLAGLKAGFEFLPCIKDRLLSDQQRAEFIIKDNLSSGEWDFDSLANNWDSQLLSDWGFSMPTWTSENPDEMGGSARQSKTKADRQSSQAAQEPSFDILLKGSTELQRLQYEAALEKMDLLKGRDFFIL